MTSTKPLLALLIASLPMAAALGQDAAAADAAQVEADDARESVAARVLDLAATGVAKLPTRPHEEDRTRRQAELVVAALEADELAVARRIAGDISNWRRALSHAAIAAHLAEAGETDAAKKALREAEGLERELTGETVQGWRRDRVRGQIAATYAHLGDRATAAAIQALLVPEEAGKLATLSVRFTELDPEVVDSQVEGLVKIADTATMEAAFGALSAIVELYGRFGGEGETDAERRASLEGHVRGNWKRVPSELRIRLLRAMAEHDHARGDRAAARGHVDEAVAIILANTWNPEQAVGLRGEAAVMLHRAGDEPRAREILGAALVHYEENLREVSEIFHGRALRPLAEAYARIGDRTTADELYKRALACIVPNPNGRPRANNLVATAISIVEVGHEPSKGLMSMMERMGEGLKAPW